MLERMTDPEASYFTVIKAMERSSTVAPGYLYT